MPGIDNPNVIDLITHDPQADEFALIIVAQSAWSDSNAQLAQLERKIENYIIFALNGGLVANYPQAEGKPVRLQLDTVEPLSAAAADVIAGWQRQLAGQHIRFLVSQLG